MASWNNPCLKFNSHLLPLPVSLSPGMTQEVRLHKRDLQSVRVLGQVERKLIVAVVAHRLIVAFDQHAVHELAAEVAAVVPDPVALTDASSAKLMVSTTSGMNAASEKSFIDGCANRHPPHPAMQQ